MPSYCKSQRPRDTRKEGPGGEQVNGGRGGGCVPSTALRTTGSPLQQDKWVPGESSRSPPKDQRTHSPVQWAPTMCLEGGPGPWHLH